MVMQVQCPNASCGKVLTVQDQYAGKKGKCPSCGGEVTIPATGAADRSGLRRSSQPFASPTEVEPEPVAVLPGDAQEEEEDRPVRSGATAARGAEAVAGAGFMTHAALAIGIAALLFLSFSPKLGWVYVSTAAKPAGANPASTFPLLNEKIAAFYLDEPQAVGDFLYCSLLTAMLAFLALIAAATSKKDLTNGAIAVSGSAAVGWGVLAGIWQLAVVWKLFRFSSYFHDQQLRSPSPSIDTTVWPGPGLGIGLLAALVVVVVFGILVASRKRFLWLLTAGVVGFVMGILLLVLHVKPWKDFGQ